MEIFDRLKKVATTLDQLGFSDLAIRVEAQIPGKPLQKVKPQKWTPFKRQFYPGYSKKVAVALGEETVSVMRQQLAAAGKKVAEDAVAITVVPMYYMHVLKGKKDPLEELMGKNPLIETAFYDGLDIYVVPVKHEGDKEAGYLPMWKDRRGNMREFPKLAPAETPAEAMKMAAPGQRIHSVIVGLYQRAEGVAIKEAKQEIMAAVQTQGRKMRDQEKKDLTTAPKGPRLGQPGDQPRGLHPGQR